MAITPTNTWYQGTTGGASGGSQANVVRKPVPSNRSGNTPYQGYAPNYTPTVTGGASGMSMANAGSTTGMSSDNHPRTVIGQNAITGPSSVSYVSGVKPAIQPSSPNMPVAPMSAQDKEMQAIERAAKGRMALANSQSDMNRAAMLQDANEKSFSQGLDPNSNAAWSTRQRATDQAGIQGNQIQNQALDMNTQAMLNEQDQITQRENQQSDIQSNRDYMTTQEDKANKLTSLQYIIDNSDPTSQNYKNAQEDLLALSGLNSTAGRYDTTSMTKENPNNAAARTLLSGAGLEATPENIKLLASAVANGDESSVLTQLKGGQGVTLETYNAGNAKFSEVMLKPSTVSTMTSGDWSTMTESQLSQLSEKLGTRGSSFSWPTQVDAGTVLMHENTPYKVVYDPKGSSGKYMQDMSGNYFFIDYKGNVQPSTQDNILNAYKRRHDGFMSGDAGTTATARKKLNLPA